ncbi:hypothetical protein FBULB1_801 [Fusarium bulbicola]|nr:hypothetical protein FBULB1_801 [Fusarium bulbicola]
MDSFHGMIQDFDAIMSMESFLDVLVDFENGVKTLTKDLKSQDVNQVTELVNLLIKGMKSIASAFQVSNTDDLNDPDLLREFHKLLQLTEFDAKLAYTEVDREEALKYPRLTTSNCEERFEILRDSIEYFVDFVIENSPGMRACIPSFTKLVAAFTGIVMEYLKLQHRHIAMQVEGVAEDKAEGPDVQHLNKEEVLGYVSRSFSIEFIGHCLRHYHQWKPLEAVSVKLTWDSNKQEWIAKKEEWTDAFVAGLEGDAIQVLMIEPTQLLYSQYKGKERYDDKNDIPCHPLLQRCKLDLLDREEGVLHWSLGGVVAWKFYGQHEWMDRFGHVIDSCEYTISNRQLR